MFQSKTRPIVLPQSEHARLAGLLAYHWGNADFDRPALDFGSFVKGVAEHDRGYGLLDNAPIDGVSLKTWLTIQRKSLLDVCEDMVANVVCWMHVRRLLSYDSTPERDELRHMADNMIDEVMAQLDMQRVVFEWADTVTHFCDTVAFHFGFDEPKERSMEICHKTDSSERIPVQYWLKEGGIIQVKPWVFSVDRLSGFIMGYEADGYPDRLEPVLLPYSIEKG